MKELPRCTAELGFDGLVAEFGHDRAARESTLLDVDMVGWDNRVGVVGMPSSYSLGAEGGDEDDGDKGAACDKQNDEAPRGARCDWHGDCRLKIGILCYRGSMAVACRVEECDALTFTSITQ